MAIPATNSTSKGKVATSYVTYGKSYVTCSESDA